MAAITKTMAAAGTTSSTSIRTPFGEFRILTSNFSAESGTSSGAVVNIAIRSGTKNYHGMLYEYWRNDHLQAYAFSALTKNKLRWNNPGGNIGGPVLIPGTRFNHDKDKLFFFFSEDLKYLRHERSYYMDGAHPCPKIGSVRNNQS